MDDKVKRANVRLSAHDHKLVTESAEWRGVTSSRVLRDAITYYAIEQACYLLRLSRGDEDTLAALEARRAEVVRAAFEQRAAPDTLLVLEA